MHTPTVDGRCSSSASGSRPACGGSKYRVCSVGVGFAANNPDTVEELLAFSRQLVTEQYLLSVLQGAPSMSPSGRASSFSTSAISAAVVEDVGNMTALLGDTVAMIVGAVQAVHPQPFIKVAREGHWLGMAWQYCACAESFFLLLSLFFASILNCPLLRSTGMLFVFIPSSHSLFRALLLTLALS